MLDLANLLIQVTTKGVNKAEKELDGLDRQGQKTEKTFKGAAKTISGAIGAIAGAAGVVKFTSDLVSVNSEFQRLDASLRTVTGSALGAEVAFDMLENFATTTPYQLDQVVGSFIKLKARGLDPSEESLRSYGNTAAAMGHDLDKMIEAVADAATGEFERLKEFGVDASKQGEQIKFTFDGVTTTVKNNAEAIEGYLRKLGDQNFGDAMEQQMKTVGGAMSNFRDAYDKMLREIGEKGFNDAIIEALRELSSIVSDPAFTDNIATLGSNLAEVIPLLAKAAGYGAEFVNWINEGVSVTAEWAAAYSTGQVSFWEWMTASKDEARQRLYKLKEEMGVFAEEEERRKKAEEQKTKYVEEQKAKAAKESAEKAAAAAIEAAEKEAEAKAKTLQKDREVYEKELASYESYLSQVEQMHQAAVDRYKARQADMLASHERTAALLKDLQAPLEVGSVSTDPLDRYFEQVDKLEAKEKELANVSDPEKRIKGLQELQREWSKMGRPIQIGTDLIVTQEETIERAAEAIKRLGETIKVDQVQALEAAKAAVDSLASEQKRAAQVIEDYEAKINTLQATIASLDKDIVLSVEDRASAVIDSVMRKMEEFKRASQSLANDPFQSGTTTGSSYSGTYGTDFKFTSPKTIELGSYAIGTDYVPKDGLYRLHQGEKVVRAGEGAGGAVTIEGGIHVNFPGVSGVDQRTAEEIAREIAPRLQRILNRKY